MGNHNTHGGKGDSTPPSRHSSNNSSKKGISRTASGADIQEKMTTQLLPVEKLAKVSDMTNQRRRNLRFWEGFVRSCFFCFWNVGHWDGDRDGCFQEAPGLKCKSRFPIIMNV